MDRRHCLGLMLAAGTAVVLDAGAEMGSPDTPMGSQPSVAVSGPSQVGPWFKDPAPFNVHGDNGLEARLENMQGMLTPNRLFFVRNTRSAWTWTRATGISPWNATRSRNRSNQPARKSAACPAARSRPAWNARAITAPCST